MTLKSLKLPSLDTLLHLECAARHQSFSAAAEELGVSQAAVSKRIRQMEDWLGTTLFERAGRGVRTTAAGERLAKRVRAGFDFIEDAVREIRAALPSTVRVGSMTAVAMFWLQPKLREFALSEQACNVSLVLSDRPADLLTDASDLVLVYGDGHFPGWTGTQVLTEILQPVCVPEIVRRAQGETLAEVARVAPILDFPRLGPDWLDWQRWAARSDSTVPENRVMCSTYAHSIGRALRGEGVALGSLELLESELRCGELMACGPAQMSTSSGYWLLKRVEHAVPAEVAELEKFLMVSTPCPSTSEACPG